MTEGYGGQEGTNLTGGNVLPCDIAWEVLENVKAERISGSHERLRAVSIEYASSSRIRQPAGIMWGGEVGDEENIACADEVGSKEDFKIWARENVNHLTRIFKEGKKRVLVDVFIDRQEDVSKG